MDPVSGYGLFHGWFLVLSYLFVGLFNLRTIRKIRIIEMLSTDKENEPSLKKSRQMPVVAVLYEGMVFWMLFTGIQKMYYYFDSRFAAPVHVMFWGNILLPAATLLWPVLWRLVCGRKRRIGSRRNDRHSVTGLVWKDGGKDGFPTLVFGLLLCAVCCTFMTAYIPVMRNRYITTAEPIPYTTEEKLDALFLSVYPEKKEDGAGYGIRMRTLQVNSTKAGMFVLQAVMIYGGIVLMVICLTILSLQQLLDAGHYRYRFSVLRNLGVEESFYYC